MFSISESKSFVLSNLEQWFPSDNSLNTSAWSEVAVSIKNLAESTTPGSQNLLPWAKAFFKPSAVFQIQPESWEAYCKNWLDFCQIVQSDSALLSTPPPHAISFTIGSDYLPRCVSYLSQLSEPQRKIQLQLLDDFPSQTIVNNIIASGYQGPIANRLISNGAVPKGDISLETIRKQLNLQSFIAHVLIFSIQNRMEAFSCLLNFFKKINLEKSESLNNEEKRIISSIVLNGLQAPAESWKDLSSWLVLARRVRDELGIEVLVALTEQATDTVLEPITLFTKTAQLMLELVPFFNDMLGKKTKTGNVDNPEDIFDLLSKFKSLDLLFKSLQDLKIRDYESRFPEKPIEQVFKEFLTPSSFLRFPCAEEELRLIFGEYEQIVKYGTEYKDKPLGWLGTEARQLGDLEQTSENKCRLLSIIRQSIRLQFGIWPYNTQMLVILAILNAPDILSALKGRIAQARTGEGKSTITTMLVTYVACQGRTVDVITVNHYLAVRDAIKYRDYYKQFNIRCSHICHQNPEPEHFDAEVIFGTNTDFEFSIMRDAINDMNLRFIIKAGIKEPREYDVAVVDEVDSLFIDTALNSARIANPASRDVSWVYAPLWKMFQEMPLLFINATPDMLRAVLINHQNGLFSMQAKMFTDLMLTDWKNSAIIAYSKKLNHDYILEESDQGGNRDPEVVIMDAENAGRSAKGSRWPNGIHEFVEVKHNFQPARESDTVAALSHPEFFGLYKNVYGLTGTMGEDIERREIAEVYKVISFDTPPHKPCIRKEELSQLTISAQEHAEAIIQEIKKQQNMMRPILVLFVSVEESENFSALLRERKINHFVLNEKQKEDEDFIVAQAGEAGQVTISTNMAGRGTDIILSSVSREAGGLHVIFTFLPINNRVEEQGYGRAGRQGQPGTCHMILNIEDPLISSLIESVSEREALVERSDFLDILREKRRTMVEKGSERRKAAAQREMVVFKFALKKFFDYLADIRQSMKNMDASLIKVAIQKESTTTREWLNNLAHPKRPSLLTLIHNAKAIVAETGDLNESFGELFRKSYIDFIIEEWAIFFGALTHDRHHALSVPAYEDYVKNAFEGFVNTKIGVTLESPVQDFCDWLSVLSSQDVGNESTSVVEPLIFTSLQKQGVAGGVAGLGTRRKEQVNGI